MPLHEPPIIVAHRGLHQSYPENSCGALVAALRAGFQWIECDVRSSRDGTPVIIHDETLDRTTTGMGIVADKSWDELKTISLRQADGSPSAAERLPSLYALSEDDWSADGLMPPSLLIEIKPSDARSLVARVVNKSALERGWILQSFDETNLVHALVANPKMPVAILVEDRESLDRAISNRWDRVHLSHELLDSAVAQRLHNLGAGIGVWTVNDESDVRRVLDIGVDMIITDDPLGVKRIVDRERRFH